MSRRLILIVALALALSVAFVVAHMASVLDAPGLQARPLVGAVAEADGVAGREDLAIVQSAESSPEREAQRSAVAATADSAWAQWDGRVEDALSGAPLANAVVRLQRDGERVEAITGDAGEFSIWASRDPDLTLLVAHDSYVDLREARPDLSPGRVLRLDPSGSIRGALRGPGAAAGDSQVALWSSSSREFDDEPLARTTPDGELAFGFDDLAPGLYGIGVVGGHGPLVFKEGVLVRPPTTTIVTLEVPSGLGLSGQVVEGDARRPVARARVSVQCEIQGIDDGVERLSNRDAETDDEGRFTVAGLAEGTAELDVRSPWGARRRLNESVSSLGPQDEVLVVFPEPARIAGIVRTSLGAPATAIVGVLTDRDRNLRRGLFEDVRRRGLEALDETVHAWTGADGRFVLDRVPSTERLYLFALPDPEDAEPEGPASLRLDRLAPGQSVEDVELALVASTAVTGRVTDEEGAPIPGARVELVRELLSEWQTIDEVETGESGSFVLHGAVRGQGSVVASHHDYDRRRVRLNERSLEEPLELRLSTSPTAHGRVVDEAGRAVADVVVRLRLQRNRRSSRSDRTDEFGRFRLERLAPGTYQVELRDAEWRLSAPDEEQLVEIPSREELVLVAHCGPLELPASVGGEVLDAATGAAIPNLRIDGARGGVLLMQGRRFDLQGMRPGEASLELEASGYETIRTEARIYTPGSHAELGTFALWRAGDLRVSVVDPDGNPLRGATVVLHALPLSEGGAGAERGPLPIPEERRWRRGRGRSRDRGGAYARDDVPLRAYDLTVRRDGFRLHRTRIELRERRTELRVELTRRR